MVLGSGFCWFGFFSFILQTTRNGLGLEMRYSQSDYLLLKMSSLPEISRRGGEERRFPPPHHSQFKMNITQLVAGFPAPRELGFRLGNSA